MQISIPYGGDVIQAIYLGHGDVSYYVASLDYDFETVEAAMAAIEGMNLGPAPAANSDTIPSQ